MNVQKKNFDDALAKCPLGLAHPPRQPSANPTYIWSGKNQTTTPAPTKKNFSPTNLRRVTESSFVAHPFSPEGNSLPLQLFHEKGPERLDLSPDTFGYRSTVWTAPLLVRYLKEYKHLTISVQSVRLAIARLRIRWKRPRHQLALRPATWRQSKGG